MSIHFAIVKGTWIWQLSLRESAEGIVDGIVIFHAESCLTDYTKAVLKIVPFQDN